MFRYFVRIGKERLRMVLDIGDNLENLQHHFRD